jgi:hypothetical protein
MSGTGDNKAGTGVPAGTSSSTTAAPSGTSTSVAPAGATTAAPVGASTPAQAMVKCPKCGTSVREVARFCQRCHHTMRYECPSCKHTQRAGGTCEKCGIDFLKYIGAVMAQKQAAADVVHERLEQRSNLMKNLLLLPFTLGFPILRAFFVKRARRS